MVQRMALLKKEGQLNIEALDEDSQVEVRLFPYEVQAEGQQAEEKDMSVFSQLQDRFHAKTVWNTRSRAAYFKSTRSS